MGDWITADNAAEWQAWAALAQGLFAFVLIGLTIHYQRTTRNIARDAETLARSTHELAAATEKIAAAAQQERLDSTLPVITFRLGQSKHAVQFTVEVVNGGVGPALDLRVAYLNSPLRYRLDGPPQPIALIAGEAVEIELRLRRNDPFIGDSSRLRWPRTSEDRRLQDAVDNAERMEGFPIRYKDPKEYAQNREERDRRYKEYDAEVRQLARTFQRHGVLHATYRDVHGRRLESEVQCSAADLAQDDWPKLQIEPLSFRVSEGR